MGQAKRRKALMQISTEKKAIEIAKTRDCKTPTTKTKLPVLISEIGHINIGYPAGQ